MESTAVSMLANIRQQNPHLTSLSLCVSNDVIIQILNEYLQQFWICKTDTNRNVDPLCCALRQVHLLCWTLRMTPKLRWYAAMLQEVFLFCLLH